MKITYKKNSSAANGPKTGGKNGGKKAGKKAPPKTPQLIALAGRITTSLERCCTLL